MRIGFIGLGNIGRPMARRLLQSGYELVVHNRSRAAVVELVRLGANPATSPRAVAERSDVVLTALPFPSSVREVYLGSNGLLEGARPDLICIDHSTVGPDLSREIAAALGERGVQFLDAPVSGGPEGAAAGTLAIMVGGSPTTFERAGSVLETLGKRVVHCGPHGAGSAVKLVNQLLVTIHSVAAAEALAFAERSEVDPALALELVSAGLGGSGMLSRNGPRIVEADYTPGARIDLMVKDAGLIRDLCGDRNLELPVFSRARQTFETALEHGAGPQDLAAVVETIRGSAAATRDDEPAVTSAVLVAAR